MQKLHSILFTFFLTFILTASLSAKEMSHSDSLLSKADTLFAKKKYTEAYSIYYNLYLNDKKYTAQTILKMAFIKEALSEHTEALYFLNLFYEINPDKRIFNKMKEIAEREKLSGYNYSDVEFFSNLYRNYHDEIIIGILLLYAIIFLSIVSNRILIKGISTSSPYFFIILIIGALYLLNYGERYINPQKGVVMKEHLLVMDGPSPGAKILGSFAKGTRIVFKNENDIWVNINYNKHSGYIRKSSCQLYN